MGNSIIPIFHIPISCRVFFFSESSIFECDGYSLIVTGLDLPVADRIGKPVTDRMPAILPMRKVLLERQHRVVTDASCLTAGQN